MTEFMIPLGRPEICEEDISEAVRVLRTGMLVQGVEVSKFESFVSKLVNTSYASAVSNGTAGLHLALLALGIGYGDEIIIPAFSFIATANSVELVGARCVFVDIHPGYFNIDENKIEEVISERTKAIIVVHEFGLCANMPEIMKVADRNGLKVIEDAACAIGATLYKKHAGSFGDIGSFSFHPRKSITSGEGGMIVTSEWEYDQKVKTFRNHGIEPGSFPNNFIAAGFNYRMTDFQAALVLNQFMRLDYIIETKTDLASVYFEEIKHKSVRLPEIAEGAKHSWQTFHVLCEDEKMRNNLMAYLKEKGVQTNYGAQCIPAMSYYRNKYNHNSETEFPNALKAYSCGLALPIYSTLRKEQVKYISELINKF